MASATKAIMGILMLFLCGTFALFADDLNSSGDNSGQKMGGFVQERPRGGEIKPLPPPDEDDEDGMGEPPRRQGRDGGDLARPSDGRNPREPQLTAEDIEKTLEFLKENSPERLEMLKNIEERADAASGEKGSFLKKLKEKVKDKLGLSKASEEGKTYFRIIADTHREMMEMERMKEENPEEYERMNRVKSLEKSCRQIMEKLHGLKRQKEGGTQAGGKSEELKGKLKSVLSELFDIRESGREKEIKDIEQRLKELKEKLEKRRKSKEAIVDKRLKELLGEEGEDDMGW